MESQTFKVQLTGTYIFKEGTPHNKETFAMVIEVEAGDEQEAEKIALEIGFKNVTKRAEVTILTPTLTTKVD